MESFAHGNVPAQYLVYYSSVAFYGQKNEIILRLLLFVLLLGLYCPLSRAACWIPEEEVPPLSKPLRIAQITDTHIVPEGALWHGVDTAERLRQVIQNINTLNPDLVIHTGDITEDGDIPSYQRALSLLNELKMPYYVTMGNHDNFQNLQTVFKDQPFESDQFSHYIIRKEKVRLMVLDSTIPGEVHGDLCVNRLNWIDKQIGESAFQLPVLIFMHHFPITVSEPLFNKFNLHGYGAQHLSSSIMHPNVKGVFCGHYHHAALGSFSNTKCWISPSTAPSHHVEGDQCLGINLTPPSYTLHTIMGNDDNVFSKIIIISETKPL